MASPALAQSPGPRLIWRLQSSYPTTLDTIYGASLALSRSVEEATDGRFRIEVLPEGTIVPPMAVPEGVADGTVEMGQTSSYFSFEKDPAFAFGTGIPFGPNTRAQNAWFYHGGGNDLLNSFYETHGLFHLPSGGTGTQMGGWFRKEVRSVSDLRGLRMRLGGLAGSVLGRLGLVPTQLAPGAILSAFERGALDAAEFVGPADDERLGLFRVAPFYHYPGFWEGAASLSFFINLRRWTELPPAYRSLLRTAALAASTDMTAKYDTQNPLALKRLIGSGVQLRPFPQDLLSASVRAANELYAELSARSVAFKTLLEHQTAFRNLAYSWWQISDFAYDGLMIQALRTR